MRLSVIAAALVAAIALPAAAANYTDWWWGGPARSGEGVNVGQQGNLVFVSWFAYDEQGTGMWVVFSGPLDTAGRTVAGTLYRTTGPALGTTFDPAKVVATAVGTGALTFTDMHHATFDWTVGARSGALPLVRQTFGASRIAGTYEGTTNGNLVCPDMGYYGEPTNTPVHGPVAVSIAVSGDQATGTARVGAPACDWSGTFTQSGQTVHVQGTATCPAPAGPAMFDLTLLVLDRAMVGWQRTSWPATGCVQTEQFALVPSG